MIGALFFIHCCITYGVVFSHTSSNNSDVIITYSGHAEATTELDLISTTFRSSEEPQTTRKLKIFVPKYVINRESTVDPVTDDVVFIPNEKVEISRNGDEFPSKDEARIQDLVGRSVGDILNEQKIRIESGTEPSKDIFFVSGKNNENIEPPKPKVEKKMDTRRSGKEIELNCKNLDCNNTISSVCGGKYEHREWRYRIFLNPCYFRKVNCGFNYPENRYKEVPIEKCKHIGSHLKRSSLNIYIPAPPVEIPKVHLNFTRRGLITRRALTKDVDSQGCGHLCPVICPEDYEPECAASPSGERRVFLNHCKLDQYSCLFGLVWYTRPLSECVGGKKAEMRQNRAFIGWMQRVGIVNNKGKLVLS